jgi:hypothetical protein
VANSNTAKSIRRQENAPERMIVANSKSAKSVRRKESEIKNKGQFKAPISNLKNINDKKKTDAPCKRELEHLVFLIFRTIYRLKRNSNGIATVKINEYTS